MGRKLFDKSAFWKGTPATIWQWIVRLSVLVGIALVIGQPARAQTVTRYSNASASALNAISDTLTPCTTAGSYKRTFTVGTSYTVSDVNIGALVTHTYRGDLQMFLTSPAGTRIQLTAGSNTNSAANFNNLFDDQATSSITSYTAGATITTVPPYASTYRPITALSGFNGQNSLGTWTLEICDQYAADSGTFHQADLYLTQAPTVYADLALTMSASTTAPTAGGTISYTLTVTNAAGSPSSATGVVVRDVLPAGLSYSSYSGFGTYNSTTGDWTVGTLTAGQSRSITITATVSASGGAIIANSAEITASGIVDIDSTVNNGLAGEDDYASVSVTVSGGGVAGTPPVLTCAIGTNFFDWSSNAWSAGARSNSYTVSGWGTLAFGVTTSGTGDPTLSGQPVTSTALTGGATSPRSNLYLGYDFTTQAQEATVTITLPSATPGAQFKIFDVDYGAGSWADHIVITGSFNGTTVYPTVTNGVSNWVAGNEAYGSASSASSSANGNLTVTFLSTIDKIVIRYGNHSAAPADPQTQVIGIDAITFCKPVASIGVTKVSSILSDPVNGASNPKAIPGALVEYCILVTNTGTATVTNVTASDPLPGNFTLATGTMFSGTACAGASTAEDDDAVGADETDPVGAAVSGTTLTATAGSLSAAQSFALRFRGTVN